MIIVLSLKTDQPYGEDLDTGQIGTATAVFVRAMQHLPTYLRFGAVQGCSAKAQPTSCKNLCQCYGVAYARPALV